MKTSVIVFLTTALMLVSCVKEVGTPICPSVQPQIDSIGSNFIRIHWKNVDTGENDYHYCAIVSTDSLVDSTNSTDWLQTAIPTSYTDDTILTIDSLRPGQAYKVSIQVENKRFDSGEMPSESFPALFFKTLDK